MQSDPIEYITDRLGKSARAVRAEDIVAEINRQLDEKSIPAIYRNKILTQRTRQYELRTPAKKLRVEVLHTLLGIELKIGNRRLLCPDLATARYLSVFARVGCDLIAVPYDITRISWIADELDSSWHRMMLLMEHFTAGRSERLRNSVRRRFLQQARSEILELGAGSKFPEFNTRTKQRR
ncbi:MAG TPA: hypothetical protein VNS63_13020 [Blastocatellia bacterium]|nr:hypothetical protein [Blastocatellia bacterium]